MRELQHEDKTARYLDRLSDALDSGALSKVKKLLSNLNGAELGDLLESLPQAERQVVWDLVKVDVDGDVLVEVNDQVRAGLIKETSSVELIQAMEGLDIDDLADILNDLPEDVVAEVLRAMNRQDRERLAHVMSYPEDSAGGLMDPNVVTIRPDVSLDVVLRYLRLRGDLPQVFDQLFVVDRTGAYLGQLRLADVLTSDPSLLVSDMYDTSMKAIPVEMPASQVGIEFEHRDLISAPVVDQRGMLIGRITIDDVVDVIREEGEHMVLTAAGLDEEDDMFAPVMQSARRRWVWLGVNLITALLASVVLFTFEATLDQLVELAVLFPIVMSMGGIAGTQTLTLVIRGMATGQVSQRNAGAILRKELAVGVANGIVFSVVIAGIAYLWYGKTGLGMVMALAIIANLVVGALAGALIPGILKRMSIDPALAGGVVLTTVTDVIGILAFIGLASLLLLAQ
jgi:magnesium transporter